MRELLRPETRSARPAAPAPAASSLRPGGEMRLAAEGTPVDRARKLPPARIELHIEELVLRGVAASDARALGEAMQRELHDLLSGGDHSWTAAELGDVDGRDAGCVSIPAGASPGKMGRVLAQAIYGRLRQ